MFFLRYQNDKSFVYIRKFLSVFYYFTNWVHLNAPISFISTFTNWKTVKNNFKLFVQHGFHSIKLSISSQYQVMSFGVYNLDILMDFIFCKINSHLVRINWKCRFISIISFRFCLIFLATLNYLICIEVI